VEVLHGVVKVAQAWQAGVLGCVALAGSMSLHVMAWRSDTQASVIGSQCMSVCSQAGSVMCL
jgi:hypothetical protein